MPRASSYSNGGIELPLIPPTSSQSLALRYTSLIGAAKSQKRSRWRYPKQGVALDYDGWVQLGYTDPIGDFASASVSN